MKRCGQCGRKVGWIVKRYGKYGRKVSWIVKRYGKCGRKVGWIVKRAYIHHHQEKQLGQINLEKDYIDKG